MSSSDVVVVGVLAMQGAFQEHINHISRIGNGVQAVAVRTPHQLSLCHALIIPGGESTAIALGAARAGLLEPLRAWVRQGKPTWGTCAGMIMLAREATGGKKMQDIIGGWDGRVSRNGWGSQVDSFETPLDISVLSASSSSSSSRAAPPVEPFPGVFIRAPVVERILPAEEIRQVPAGEPVPAGRRPGEELDGIQLIPKDPSIVGAEVGTPDALPSPANEYIAPLRLAVAPPMPNAGNRGPVQVLARLPADVRPNVLPGPDADVVALRQDNIFVTSFHPELTRDNRLHQWWVNECVRKA
ncbi:unnamed protein product [Parajaminaea phylloscopi]